ncbi:MAG: AMP-binding protein [Candidatus Methylacidiphilales bacterium]|nr:AMP-binding protein [Candidatus Methylacidiphilales bacterium]
MDEDRKLTQHERFPLLTPQGEELLKWMHEHENAPKYNHFCGDRLTAERMREVRGFEDDLRASESATDDRRQQGTDLPGWVESYVEACRLDVPYYRRVLPHGAGVSFHDLPSFGRQELTREFWAFVPDSASLQDLIRYDSSGRTGHPIRIPGHPLHAAKYLPLLKRTLRKHGVVLEGEPGKVAILLACAQRRTVTTATIATYLNQAGFSKINLRATDQDWREPGDVAAYINACRPEIITGDPLSFLALCDVPLAFRPKALVSTSMALSPAFRLQIEARVGAPVLNVYSMTETGPIGVEVYSETGDFAGFEILSHDTYVEILDEEDNPCPPGVRGEITITGGRNPYLPLIRYRTGDWGTLDVSGKIPRITQMEGRAPTVFRDESGALVNNVDVTHVLRPFALPQYTLHQSRDGSLRMSRRDGIGTSMGGTGVGSGSGAPNYLIERALQGLFGRGTRIDIDTLPQDPSESGKVLQYTSDW